MADGSGLTDLPMVIPRFTKRLMVTLGTGRSSTCKRSVRDETELVYRLACCALLTDGNGCRTLRRAFMKNLVLLAPLAGALFFCGCESGQPKEQGQFKPPELVEL